MSALPVFPVLAVLLCLLSLPGGQAAPTVTCPWGQVSGVDLTSLGGRPFSAYKGIPFALPPTGQRRFAKPQPHPGVQGRVFNASTPGMTCPQPQGLAAGPQSEDCLTLNVFVPATPAAGRTVMVWIHGGGFSVGSAREYTPSEMVTENDVIVVVIQYRLGILGFLSSGDGVIPGNLGLFDQHLAIKWVKDNIRGFGGDPDSITLFGESAGSASVGYHVLSPYSRGLFQRALMQSGTPLSPWAFDPRPDKVLAFLTRATGCDVPQGWADRLYGAFTGVGAETRSKAVLDCLRDVDTQRFIQLTVFPSGPTINDVFFWVPSVDGDFLPASPEQLLSDAGYLERNGVTSHDVMVGMNNEEGATVGSLQLQLEQITQGTKPEDRPWQNDIDLDPRDPHFLSDLLAVMVKVEHGQEVQDGSTRLDTLVNVLNFFYTTSQGQGQVNLQDAADVLTDSTFTVPTVRFLRALTRAGSRVYLYLFNHYPASKAGLSQLRGTTHGEDLSYQWDPAAPLVNRDAFNQDDEQLARTFRLFTTNFANTGRPDLALDRQVGGTWPEFTLTQEQFLSLEVVPRVDDHLYDKRVALWTDLLPSLVNSTRPQCTTSWLPWQQQTGTSNMAQAYYFKGRLTFHKLP